MIVPVVDRLRKVNMQIVTMPVPAQEGITRDNVTVRVDAVVYFKVVDAGRRGHPGRGLPLRGLADGADLAALDHRQERAGRSAVQPGEAQPGPGADDRQPGHRLGRDQIDRVEIKDVSLPETMKRSMARQAEADRERRARVINADAELQASKKLAEAAAEMSDQPAALQLRLLQTVVAVAAEKNSTLVLPFPVELLRFLERSGLAGPRRRPRPPRRAATGAGGLPAAPRAP